LRFLLIALLTSLGTTSSLFPQSVTLHKKDAVVWAQDQVIEGEIDTVITRDGVLLLNGDEIPFTIPEPGNLFSVPVTVGEGESTIVVKFESAGEAVLSDTLRLTLGYELLPEIFAFAEVTDRLVTLRARVLENPEGESLNFLWEADEDNPESLGFAASTDSVTTVTIPASVTPGEYYFKVRAVDARGDTVRAATFVTVDASGIRPFDIRTDYSRWVDRAIIYEITPYNFVWAGKFRDITDKLEEIALLGVNTIWLQPVYQTAFRGQGYDVTDYFKLRTDLGSEADLRELIATAKGLGLRVMFDFVPGHTSIEHPYAKDAVAYGQDSHYYNFYAPIKEGVRYAMHYNKLNMGEMTFTYYFWQDLPMLNYDNPEVQRMMIEAGKHWIKEFDIDGYRVDAVWGANARTPEFARKWRLALKRLKPDVLLLAEDKATDPTGVVFDERFDAAYDWYGDEAWVSHWVWQTYYSASSHPTIFNNTSENQRANALRNSLTNFGQGFHPRAKILRFMENNDTFRFLATHDLARTKMVATLMFSLHGIPLLYQGQEIGFPTHPYQTGEVFFRGHWIRNEDNYGLFPFYQKLTAIRKMYPSLCSDNFEEIAVTPNAGVFAYHRWEKEENIFGVINMGSDDVSATVSLNVSGVELDSTATYYLSDLMSNEAITVAGSELGAVDIVMPGYSTRLFLFADSALATSVEPLLADAPIPGTFRLEQNYPNPFNPTTRIAFELPNAGDVTLSVYDILGRRVRTVLAERLEAGAHEVTFNGSNLASGVYFCRLEFDGRSHLRKMLLVK